MGELLFITSSGTPTVAAQVVAFARGATGNAAPVRILGGPDHAQLTTASGISHDADGFLYVGAPVIKSVNVYRPSADGDIPPFAILSGPSAGLVNPQGVAIHGGRLYVANGPFGPGSTAPPSVAAFALPLAAGVNDVAPIAVIAGSATGLDSPFGLAVDAAGSIYVANLNNTVTVYRPPRESSYANPDNAGPILTISTGLGAPEGLAIRGDALYVANDLDSITEYALPSGTPRGVITGNATKLDGPLGIAVDAAGNIFVVNTADQVLEFAAGARGNVPPTATIAGPATGLSSAQFVVVGPS